MKKRIKQIDLSFRSKYIQSIEVATLEKSIDAATQRFATVLCLTKSTTVEPKVLSINLLFEYVQ